MKFSTENNSSINFEQAAGFPPFTRGYKEFNFNTNVDAFNQNTLFDFQINSTSVEEIYELFKLIIAKPNTNKKLNLLISVPINKELISFTAALRTILSLVNEVRTSNPASSQFRFFIKSTNTEAVFIERFYCEASQINWLLASKQTITLLESIPKNPVPIDPFFGSPTLETQTNELISSIWLKIYKLL